MKMRKGAQRYHLSFHYQNMTEVASSEVGAGLPRCKAVENKEQWAEISDQ